MPSLYRVTKVMKMLKKPRSCMLPVCVGLLIPFGSMRRTKSSLVRDAWTSVPWRASFRALETELLEQLNIGRELLLKIAVILCGYVVILSYLLEFKGIGGKVIRRFDLRTETLFMRKKECRKYTCNVKCVCTKRLKHTRMC